MARKVWPKVATISEVHCSCIRICLLYNRVEHITIDRLHHEMKIVSLEQQRRVQCLKLMYRLSKKPSYITNVTVNTRGNNKTKFKLMAKCTSKYLNSPYTAGRIYGMNLIRMYRTCQL